MLVLGTIATLDLFDAGPTLPWMGERPWPDELLGGLAGAVVIPCVLGLLWGRFRVAGTLSGVALAVLFHVSVVLLVLTGLYQAVEWAASRAPRAAAAVAAVVVAVSVVVLGIFARW